MASASFRVKGRRDIFNPSPSQPDSPADRWIDTLAIFADHFVLSTAGSGDFRAIESFTRTSLPSKTGSAKTAIVLAARVRFAISCLSRASVDADGRLTT